MRFRKSEMSHFPPPIRSPLYRCFPFLIEKGEIFTWGNGSNGKLGHGDGDTRYKYTFDALILIRSLSRFIQLLVIIALFQPTPGFNQRRYQNVLMENGFCQCRVVILILHVQRQFDLLEVSLRNVWDVRRNSQ